jgi:hypothetical protein
MSMSVEAKILIPADIWLAVDEMAGATGKLVSEVIVDVLRESMARTGREALGRESIDATGWAEAAFPTGSPEPAWMKASPCPWQLYRPHEILEMAEANG